MLARYQMFAGYNAWCNERLYQAAAKVPDTDYRANRGVFFKSLHGTLNHLLVGDRIWMRRFTGQGETPPSLDAVLLTTSRSCVPRAASKTNASALTSVPCVKRTWPKRSVFAPWLTHKP